MENRRRIRLVFAAIALLAVGFAAGASLYVPLERWLSRSRMIQRYKAEKRELSQKFLNKEAPPLSTKTLAGEDWHLQDQRGKVVLLFFWQTSCKFCLDMVSTVREIYNKYGHREDFLIAGVSIDNDKDMVFCFSSVKAIPWLQLHEEGKGWDNSFAQALDVRFVPSVWIIDKEGKIRGFHLRGEQIENTLSRCLGTVSGDAVSGDGPN